MAYAPIFIYTYTSIYFVSFVNITSATPPQKIV